MTEQATQEIIIKKYANRRLYDTDRSAYVTLDDLAELVKRDITFVVQDAKTGEDLTRQILTQIIFEQESKGYNLLPVNFLRQVISFYGHNVSAVLPPYLEQMMQHFVENQDQVKGMMGNMTEFSPLKQFEEMGRKNMEMLEQTMNIFNPFGTNKK